MFYFSPTSRHVPHAAATDHALAACAALGGPFRTWSEGARLVSESAYELASLFDPFGRGGREGRAPSRNRPSLHRAATGQTNETRTFSCAHGTRDYRLFVPALPPGGARGLVVMLHGCRQDADEFARGTRMNELAERHGLIVAWPNQNRTRNSLGCWQWFLRRNQRRGKGEPAILAELARSLATEFEVPDGRIFAAGLSAGGAMCAILGATYPDVFAAIGIHSGLPYGAAKDVSGAHAAMRGDTEFALTEPEGAATIPTIVFHGDADETVHPENARRIMLSANPRGSGLRRDTAVTSLEGGRRCHRTCHSLDGAPYRELWMIEGAGHAWSGGSPFGSYTEMAGPDASAEMVRFFLRSSGQPEPVRKSGRE